MTDWSRIGSPGNPVHVRDIPGGTATVSRGEGGKWNGTIVVRVSAGDSEKVRARVDEIVKRIGSLP